MSDHKPIESDDPPLDDVALEALAEAYATPPPPALRDRLLAAASAGAAARRAATRWRTLGSLAAATTLVMGGLLASVLRHSGARESELAQVLRVLAGPRTLVATLAPTAGQPASGRVVVDASTGEAALVVVGLDAPGEGKTYELWAIRGDRPPAPAGLFAGGRTAVAQMPRVPDPTSVTAFAVSIEPSGGSTSPTGPIVLAGPVRS
jgi:anti-sigma-K factor RskA